jgi:cell wall-associated NlpC family hydrolase
MRTGRRSTRIVVTVALMVLLALSLAAPSIAAPSNAESSKAKLEAARNKLEALQHSFEQAVEDYDYAKWQLAGTREKLDAAQAAVEKATAAADKARGALDSRTVAAYQGTNATALDMLLGSEDLSDFADRLAFLDQMAAHDADLLAQAQVTGEQADRAAQNLGALEVEERKHVDDLAAAKTNISDNIDEQSKLVGAAQADYQAALEAQRAAEQAAEQSSDVGSTAAASSSTGGAAPSVSSGASGAVQAALSMVGKPYVWGAASPSAGFDCSGLTLWAWAQVGVSLPHSSAAQYAVLPHVDKSDLQPGDLLFFYSPISHVAMYIGGNQVVHATNPSNPVGVDSLSSYWWDEFVGAGRPG